MVQQNCQEATTNSKNPLWDGKPPWGERISAENLMAIRKSFDLENKKMTQKIGNICGLFKESSFIVLMLNREYNLRVKRWIMPLFHKIYNIERNSSEKKFSMRGERIGENPKDHERKGNSIVRDIVGKGRDSVFYYNFAHEFVPMKRSQVSSSLNSLWRWKQAHVVSSRGTACLWDKILQVTLKIWGVRDTHKWEPGKKEYELRMWFWSANFGNRELRMVQKTLEICLSETHALGNREAQTKDLSSKPMLISNAKRQWKRNERRS